MTQHQLTEDEQSEVTREPEEVGQEVGHGEALERILRQRERHRERSLTIRVAVALAGMVVSVLAATLSLVVPELGLPLLLVGLRLLAFEFDWAARAYGRVAKLAERMRGRFRRLSPRGKHTLVVIGVGVAAFAVWLLLTQLA